MSGDYESFIFKAWIWKYLGERKFFDYFCDMRLNSKSSDAFAEVMKGMNHTGQWDAKLLIGFASMACSMAALESMVFGRPDRTWFSRFLQPERNFLIHLVSLLWSVGLSPFIQLQISLGAPAISILSLNS